MVNEDQRGSAQYVSKSDGAPPLPPAGGYRGASRIVRETAVADAPAPTETATLERPRLRTHWLGWTALGVAVAFAVVLVVLVVLGATDALFGVTALVAQLLVVGAVVAALVTPRARRLGAVALAVALLGNVATIGGVGTLQASASGSYDPQKTPRQEHWESYPGVEDYTEQEILAQPSLEEERQRTEQAFAEAREALSDEFGYTWTRISDEYLRPERNGHGGESMLVSAQFESWSTNEPIHDLTRKREALETVSEALEANGLPPMIALNEGYGSVPESSMRHLYGSENPDEQAVWEWGTAVWGSPTQYYAVLTDLSRDPTGDFRDAAEAQRKDSGAPLEGLTLQAIASPVLSEDDVDEFRDRMRDY